MQISKEDARTILKMDEVCFSEGLGPNSRELINKIAKEWPELKDEFSWLTGHLD